MASPHGLAVPKSRTRRCQTNPIRHGHLARVAERIELAARWLA